VLQRLAVAEQMRTYVFYWRGESYQVSLLEHESFKYIGCNTCSMYVSHSLEPCVRKIIRPEKVRTFSRIKVSSIVDSSQ